jgi:hypothetical protein
MTIELPPDVRKTIHDAEVLQSQLRVEVGTLNIKVEALQNRIDLLADMINSIRDIYRDKA